MTTTTTMTCNRSGLVLCRSPPSTTKTMMRGRRLSFLRATAFGKTAKSRRHGGDVSIQTTMRTRRRKSATTSVEASSRTTPTTPQKSKNTDEKEEKEISSSRGGGLADAELNLGRSAMLGFAATTIVDASSGLGPIEQLIGEEKSIVAHVVNPINLVKDALEVTGLYVESVILVWVFLSGVFLLGVMSGLRTPKTSTSSGVHAKAADIIKVAWIEQVRENKKWELFNGRLAMLGITASFIGDYLLAEGPLEQVSQELGVPVIDQEIFALMFLSAASFVLVSTLVRVGRRALPESN